MARDDFKQKLLELAKSEARKTNYYFVSDVESGLREFIDSGVNRMSLEEYTSTLKRQQVENNLKIIVQHMVDNARNRQLRESIDVRSFSAVRLSICPLWPFC